MLKLVAPIKGRTPYWYIRGTFNGTVICASTKSTDKKAAALFKKQLEDGLHKQAYEKRRPVTFRLAAVMYSQYRRPARSDQIAIDRLVNAIGDIDLADIRQATIMSAAEVLYPQCSAETKNRHAITPAAAILHYAAENDMCSYIKVRRLKEKTPEPRYMAREDVDTLIGHALPDMRLLLTWLFYQGWRITDTLRLRWSDLDMRQETVRYYIGKTDEYHLMPLHPKTIEALRDVSRHLDGRVMAWGDKNNCYRALRPYCAAHKIKFTPHMARHTFATRLINAGANTQEVMDAGGWKSIKSVMRYAKLDAERRRSILRRLV